MDGNIHAFADASLFIMMGFNKSFKKYKCFVGGFIIIIFKESLGEKK